MPIRAVNDPQVIAAWTQATSTYRKRYGLVQPSIGLAALACIAAGVYLQNIYVVALFLVFFLALMIARAAERVSLVCPHCSQTPVNPFERASPLDIDYCSHCFYWLKSPW
jgi:hypothetical protein